MAEASRVALVTGAGRGQGRAHAVRQARAGADVIAVDICENLAGVPYPMASSADLEETARMIEKLGRRVVAVKADVRDAIQMERAVAQGADSLGRLDIVLANAGIITSDPITAMSPAKWQQMLDINLTGVWNTIRAATPSLISGGRGGCIVMTSSTAGIRGFESLAHYTTAKTGVIGLMRALVNELGKYRIRVNVVIPTACDTKMLHSDVCYGLFFGDGRSPSRDDLSATLQSIHALPVDVVTPDDIANAAAFLTSEEARYVTGTELRVDAGFCEKQLSAYVASPE
jgi:(+)-trans-carveol dehydrogenase